MRRSLRAGNLAVILTALSLSVACSNDDDRARSTPDGGARTDSRDTSTPDAPSAAISMTQIDVGSFVFDARVAGPEDGPVVILLHGFPETSYEWRNQMPVLAAAGYRAVAPDQRGYSPGARPTSVDDYQVLKLAKDVVDIADAIGANRFHLVGHDWGSGVGWAVAKIYATRVITYTSASTPHPDALQQELSDDASCQYQASAYFDSFVKPAAVDFFIDDDAGVLHETYGGLSPADVDVYVKALGNRSAMAAALDWYAANIVDRKFNLPSLGTVTVPTLLVWGTKDETFCKDTVELSRSFVQAPFTLEELDGVNHWVPENGAERFNAALLAHLKMHSSD
ncbi:MAG TPA: alpha/beta hydrolase [Polyangiaceae bacterium]|nr:alpha/beta hydrolase [Polyangiaceae bacterium]